MLKSSSSLRPGAAREDPQSVASRNRFASERMAKLAGPAAADVRRLPSPFVIAAAAAKSRNRLVSSALAPWRIHDAGLEHTHFHYCHRLFHS
jgi:hypothetical protein